MASSGTSGQKHDIINPRERAVSVDINRLQQFAASNRSELYRWMVDALTEQDDSGGGVILHLSTGGENPLAMHIFNGVMPRPQTGPGQRDMFFDPGVLLALAPDTVVNPDDSPAKLVLEPGLTTPGIVQLTANASGFTRVDVVEASVIDEVIETDSRDIFDPTTGLFTATTVDKVQRSRLTYRIRNGVPNAGFPGTVVGWAPLAVAIVPNGAVDWDGVSLFDVRNLVSDRIRPPFNVFTQTARRKCEVTTDLSVFPAQTKLLGYVEAEFAPQGLGSGWAGGHLALGNLDVGIDVSPASAAIYWEAGLVLSANEVWTLYALFPFGLPRWVLYATAAGGRIPAGMRGIPVVTGVLKPPNVNGNPSAPVGFPASYGFGAATTARGVALVSGTRNGATTNMVPILSDKNELWFYQNEPGAAVVIPAVPSNGDLSVFTLTPGVHFPKNATHLKILLALELTFVGVSTNSEVDMYGIRAQVGGVTYWIPLNYPSKIWQTLPNSSVFGGGSAAALSAGFEIPIPRGVGTISLRWEYNGNANAAGLIYVPLAPARANILGWRLGPED